jgi:hypothetical protein
MLAGDQVDEILLFGERSGGRCSVTLPCAGIGAPPPTDAGRFKEILPLISREIPGTGAESVSESVTICVLDFQSDEIMRTA